MNKPSAVPRRVSVEKNIYKRADGKLEVGYRDSTGKQRWTPVVGGITAARAVRDDVLGRKARGERVAPNPKLRFGDAADKWLAGPVASLRPTTRDIYRSHVENHLRARFGRDRMDAITGDDIAKLVRELRADGKSEWTISGVVKSCSQVYKYAAIRLAWNGTNPTTLLSSGERPKTGATSRRRIYKGTELTETLQAAREPTRTLFALAAVTGARLSEVLGLVWADVDLDDLDAAILTFEYQVDRKGTRGVLKTEESRRTVEIPRQLAAMLVKHRLASPNTKPEAFVFASRSGRALGQRNVIRTLRATQTRAVDADGKPTFPLLQDVPEGERVPKGAAPTFHGFRHSAASEAIAAGDGAEEVSWQLGHKNSNVTRTVYVQEIKTAERTAKRRASMAARYGSALEAADLSGGQPTPDPNVAEVRKIHG
ncbi:MAG: integrase family protein [Conexibacter sp.]|nr:integrase family protein [Conexibacter sp.]